MLEGAFVEEIAIEYDDVIKAQKKDDRDQRVDNVLPQLVVAVVQHNDNKQSEPN